MCNCKTLCLARFHINSVRSKLVALAWKVSGNFDILKLLETKSDGNFLEGQLVIPGDGTSDRIDWNCYGRGIKLFANNRQRNTTDSHLNPLSKKLAWQSWIHGNCIAIGGFNIARTNNTISRICDTFELASLIGHPEKPFCIYSKHMSYSFKNKCVFNKSFTKIQKYF